MYLSSCLSLSLASPSPPVDDDGLLRSSSTFSLQVSSVKQSKYSKNIRNKSLNLRRAEPLHVITKKIEKQKHDSNIKHDHTPVFQELGSRYG